MNFSKVISSAVIGTTMMTAWSILISKKANKQFREPVLLNLLLRRLALKNKVEADSVAGWLTHYLAGAAFTTVYDQLWQKQKPNLSNSLVLGGLSGLAGIGIWETAFRLHPNPPRVDYKNYYAQLFIAHLIFGLFAALGYQFPGKQKTFENRPFVRRLRKEWHLQQV